ncbi:hypothetical protein [Marinicella sp. W31]|uniref:hypothetical protein n=1 Tax=Marinicella sp. W31 TaxID=3023713 RepID=UPI003757FD1C
MFTSKNTRMNTHQTQYLSVFIIMLLTTLFFSSVALARGNGSTFTVNSTASLSDAALDGICDTGQTIGKEPECTLRAALEEANFSVGMADNITFDISGCMNSVCLISNAMPMPVITDTVVIDGSTQPGNSGVCSSAIPDRPTYGIVISGTQLQLDPGSDGSVIRGLNIIGSSSNLSIYSNDNIIECNYIGTDEYGEANVSISSEGISMECSASNNIIGGTLPEDGNLIAGHNQLGISISSVSSCTTKDLPLEMSFWAIILAPINKALASTETTIRT